MSRRKTHAEHVADIKKVNPTVEVLGEIKNNTAKVLTRCKICGHKWMARPTNLKNRHGCPECAKIKISNARRLTHAEHVAEIAAKNPNVEIIGKITNVMDKVLTRCRVCGHEWEVRPNDLKNGRGCPECRKVKIGNAHRLTNAEHIAAINKVNPDIEILGEIKGNDVKVLCRCKACSYKWETTPNTLKDRHGCPKCAGKVETHDKHVADIAKANPNVEVLGDIKNARTSVLCRCTICNHEWMAIPANIKQGQGCPRCARIGFLSHDVGKLYIMVDDLEVPTMLKIGVSVYENKRSKQVLRSAHKAGVIIPALHVAKTWEGPTDLMQRIERMMHENYAEWNIKFPAKFDGSTEFFYYTPETAEAFDIIEETYHEIINANRAA